MKCRLSYIDKIVDADYRDDGSFLDSGMAVTDTLSTIQYSRSMIEGLE